MKSLILAKTVIISGMALWMSMIVFNNIFDAGTNIQNIENTVTISLLMDDPVLGLGLKWRAWEPGYGSLLLKFVVAYQLIIIISFWFSAYRYIRVLCSKLEETVALKTVNISLITFSLLWIGFLSGGTWFGYWIKQGAFTGVHMNMFVLTLILFMFFNMRNDNHQ